MRGREGERREFEGEEMRGRVEAEVGGLFGFTWNQSVTKDAGRVRGGESGEESY